MWAVWLGRHPTEKISVGLNDKLIRLGNSELNAKVKACLTVFRTAWKADVKAGLSEPSMLLNGARM